MEEVFANNDLRRYIFNFLRKKPKAECYNCNKILIWDNKINNFIRYPRKYLGKCKYEDIFYCIDCWTNTFLYDRYFDFGCVII
jgi:hypothetical protein